MYAHMPPYSGCETANFSDSDLDPDASEKSDTNQVSENHRTIAKEAFGRRPRNVKGKEPSPSPLPKHSFRMGLRDDTMETEHFNLVSIRLYRDFYIYVYTCTLAQTAGKMEKRCTCTRRTGSCGKTLRTGCSPKAKGSTKSRMQGTGLMREKTTRCLTSGRSVTTPWLTFSQTGSSINGCMHSIHIYRPSNHQRPRYASQPYKTRRSTAWKTNECRTRDKRL